MTHRHNAILAIHREFGENNLVKIATPEHSIQ